MWILLFLLCHPVGWLILAAFVLFLFYSGGDESTPCINMYPEIDAKAKRDIEEHGRLWTAISAVRCLWTSSEQLEYEAMEERIFGKRGR